MNLPNNSLAILGFLPGRSILSKRRDSITSFNTDAMFVTYMYNSSIVNEVCRIINTLFVDEPDEEKKKGLKSLGYLQ